jgi:hypothetical protein
MLRYNENQLRPETARNPSKVGTANNSPRLFSDIDNFSFTVPETFYRILFFLELQQATTKNLKDWIPIKHICIQAPSTAIIRKQQNSFASLFKIPSVSNHPSPQKR